MKKDIIWDSSPSLYLPYIFYKGFVGTLSDPFPELSEPETFMPISEDLRDLLFPPLCVLLKVGMMCPLEVTDIKTGFFLK